MPTDNSGKKNNRYSRSSKRKNGKKQSKQYILTAAAVFALVAAVCSALFLSAARENKDSPETASSSESILETQTEQKTEKLSETAGTTAAQPTQPPASTAPAATEKPSSGSFYDSITYRSPTAVPADIFKHGRNLMLLNKEYELPEDFKWDLVYWSNGKSVDAMSLNSKQYDSVQAVDRAAYQPLKDLFKAASDAGVPLQLVSAYRSIDLQDRLFTRSVNYYINQGYSKENAIKKANYERTFSGTSEHNTGYGFDILQKGNWTLTESFENTAQFKWLVEHAEEYGFILRYKKEKTDITGIMYEPWHFRYVGVDHAKKINEMDMCLEEYIDYLES